MIDEPSNNSVNPADVGDDAISRWLDLFTRLLHLPADQCESIRDELESHVRERSRDLMLAGRAESDAIHHALAELGETALLARRFEHAERRFRTRRTIMNIATFGIAGAAVVAASTFTSVSILNLQDDPRIAIYEEGPSAHEDTSQADQPAIVAMNFVDNPFSDVADYLGEVTEADVYVHWEELLGLGINPDTAVNLRISERPFDQSMKLLFDSFPNGDELAWRLNDGLFEIATAEFFDLRERILVTFEIGDILVALGSDPFGSGSPSEQIRELIYSYVETNAWESNGGSIARLRIVGNKMFVQAPPRFMQPISWILGQLDEKKETRPNKSATTGTEALSELRQ